MGATIAEALSGDENTRTVDDLKRARHGELEGLDGVEWMLKILKLFLASGRSGTAYTTFCLIWASIVR